MDLPGMILLASVPVAYFLSTLMCWVGRLLWRRAQEEDGLSRWARVAPALRAIAIAGLGLLLSWAWYWVDVDGIEWIAPSFLALAWSAHRLRKLLAQWSSLPQVWNGLVIGLSAAQIGIVILLLPLFAEQLQ